VEHPNADNIQTKACFKAMPSGVHKRLPKLTTIKEAITITPLCKICPQHFQALQHTGLATEKVPCLTEQPLNNEKVKALKQAKVDSNNKQNR